MLAKDIMTTNVVTVTPDARVREIAQLLLMRHVSAVPVVDAENRVVGIVSEGDLMRRLETGTERHRSWWLTLVAGSEDLARAVADPPNGAVGSHVPHGHRHRRDGPLLGRGEVGRGTRRVAGGGQ